MYMYHRSDLKLKKLCCALAHGKGASAQQCLRRTAMATPHGNGHVAWQSLRWVKRGHAPNNPIHQLVLLPHLALLPRVVASSRAPPPQPLHRRLARSSCAATLPPPRALVPPSGSPFLSVADPSRARQPPPPPGSPLPLCILGEKFHVFLFCILYYIFVLMHKF
jgi:hypothetical protein